MYLYCSAKKIPQRGKELGDRFRLTAQVGTAVGTIEGSRLGNAVGAMEGEGVGSDVGSSEGAREGS